MAGNKTRLRFRKDADLRLLSHHDLMRCFERMVRRASLPLKFTAGFHPTPRIVFALSLPLGIVGLREVVEIELTDPLEADEVLDRLQGHAPTGLVFTSARTIDDKLTGVPRRVVYQLPVPAERREAVMSRIEGGPVWVERTRPRPRRVNIRPFLRNVSIDAEVLELDLWVTQYGTARADELVRRLGLQDEVDAGAVLTRTELELHDELTGSPEDAPPDGPPETEPLAMVPSGPSEIESLTATWGATPNGPVVE